MAAAQIAVRPAAGPLTLSSDLLIKDTTIPPIIPAAIPAYMVVPDANATPMHNGSATKKTVTLAFKSCLKKVYH
jgi:hypothetical protein